MEVVESSWNYNLPSQLTPAWAPIVVDTALKSLCSLFGASPESLAPPSADFIVPVAGAGTVYESDDGQIDGGVRYKELLQVRAAIGVWVSSTVEPTHGAQASRPRV
jgi:hypothetical protein